MDLEYLKAYNRYNQYGLSIHLIQPYIFNKLTIDKKVQYLKDINELWETLTNNIHDKIKQTNAPYITEVWGLQTKRGD